MKKNKIIMGLSILILLFFIGGITYSYFTSSSRGSSVDQNIAKFVFNAKNLDEFEIPLLDLNPGDTKIYDFSVSNKASGVLSEVAVEYKLTIKTYHIIPLEIELYELDGEVETYMLTCNETYSRNTENEIVCNSDLRQLNHNVEIMDNYRLKVSFPIQYNDSEYSKLVDYLYIEIKSWQKT